MPMKRAFTSFGKRINKDSFDHNRYSESGPVRKKTQRE